MTIKLWPKYICRHRKESEITEIFDTTTNVVIDEYNSFLRAEYESHQLNKKEDISYLGSPLCKILENKYTKPLNYFGCAYDPDLLNDQRQSRWAQERQEQGFDSTELWDLQITLAQFILPRLKAFKDNTGGHPLDITQEEWVSSIDRMIWSFEQIVNDDNFKETLEERLAYNERIQKGLHLFAENFRSLWN